MLTRYSENDNAGAVITFIFVITSYTQMDSVIIVGGGISGLLTGLALSKEGKNVTLFEKGEVGNVVRSYQVEGDSGTYTVDTGPHILTRVNSGPLHTLMKYFDSIPKFVPHGNYYLRMNGKYILFPWALTDFLHFDAIPFKERLTLVRCIMEGIVLPDKSVTVKDFISGYNISESTMNLVDALCYFLAGVPMSKVPVSRFWDSQKYKDGTGSVSQKVLNLILHGTRKDQYYPVGGIQKLTDSILKGFTGTIQKEEVITIDPERKSVNTLHNEYFYDFLVYSGMAHNLPDILDADLPLTYMQNLSQLESTTAFTLWVGTKDTVITNTGSEIWVDTNPPCWVVPTSVYDPELAPEGCQLLGLAFPHSPGIEKKALAAFEYVFPDASIDMVHSQVLQPDKAAWTTVPFPSVKTPVSDVYLVGTDTIKKSMGITRASYSVLQLLHVLRGEKKL
jgi:phytoene dehydrogenase-like protein